MPGGPGQTPGGTSRFVPVFVVGHASEPHNERAISIDDRPFSVTRLLHSGHLTP
jgi:hypothetical protein